MDKLFAIFDAWFKTREPRERWILAAVMIAATAWFSWIGLVEPSILDYESTTRKNNNLQAEVQALRNSTQELEIRAATDPNMELQRRIDELEKQRLTLGKEVEAKANFMPPEEILSWLEALLISADNLTIEEFNVSPPEDFIQGIQIAEENIRRQSSSFSMKSYPVTVIMQGDFFSIHDYLDALASMPHAFYWDSFDYEVLEYPAARITLKLFTLSYTPDAP